MAVDPDSIDIESLTLEEIEKLLPQLAIDLEESKRSQPIDEVVSEKFVQVWGNLEEEYRREFAEKIKKEEEDFLLKEGMAIVLEDNIGEENTKLFFKVFRDCVRNRNFKSNSSFYKKVKDPEVVKVAEVGFAVYRLNLSKRVTDDYMGGSWIKRSIADLRRSQTPATQKVFQAFSEIGLLTA